MPMSPVYSQEFSTSYLGTVIYLLLSYAFDVLGFCLIFKKCGQDIKKAFIPAYNYYAESQCGDREMEGRIVFLASAVSLVVSITSLLIKSSVGAFLSVISFLATLFGYIYLARIGFGLLDNFKASKFWVVVYMFLPNVFRLIFGLSKKRVPERTIADIKKDERVFFDKSVSVLDSGLTVNLEERTAKGFFKKATLLRDIHLNIAPGSMVLLLGGSGAGKTTFINAINGYEPAKAEIMLDGRNVYKEYKNLMYEIGYVPQLDLMRGSDTVLLTLTDAAALRLPQNFSWQDRRARVDEVMKIFGLTPVKDTMVEKLSGGQRKRLSIAMEFLSNPSLFILDEPDSGLDGVMARELMQQLRAIADQGKVVIVITHTPDRVIDLFDSVIVLAKDSHRTGRLVYFGPVDEAKEFFERDSMEKIVKSINRKEEGGDGRADELILKYAEVINNE